MRDSLKNVYGETVWEDEARPTMSFPTVTFPGESRVVARDSFSCTLINYTESMDHGVDTMRMTANEGYDSLIYPSWSNGEEHLIELGVSESVRFFPVPAEGMGLNIVLTRRSGREESYHTGGFVRVAPTMEEA